MHPTSRCHTLAALVVAAAMAVPSLAADDGADLFLAPQANCDEVAGNVPDGLDVFAVTTLEEARTIVETAAEGGEMASFARCAA